MRKNWNQKRKKQKKAENQILKLKDNTNAKSAISCLQILDRTKITKEKFMLKNKNLISAIDAISNFLKRKL